ncbi:MAG: 2-hydroxyacid dehydrogenase [Pseudomonadales bacterium]|tara:strand:- start:13797 stop:14759 length:963 start_codon:yes stop_codon:yes gene_type:complete
MQTSFSIVFLDQSTLDQGDLDMRPLTELGVRYQSHAITSPERCIERMQGYEVVVTNKVLIDAQAMDACPGLKLILLSATGTNNVDLPAARARGIVVCNCQGYGTPAVAQHTLMLMLVLITRFESYRQAVRDGAWQRSTQFCLLDYPIGELSGRTLGILGYGELGQAVGRLAEAFGMHVVVGALPGRERAGRPELHALLEQVDVLSLHCPLTEKTRNLIGADELARMRPGSLLINAGRGGLVDEQALAVSLRDGHLGGAACDVLTTEPPREGNPLLAADIPNLLITPHSAWGSREARQRIVGQLADNLQAFVHGKELRRVN